MGLQVGQLQVELDALDAKFDKAFDDAEKRITSFEQKADTGTAKAAAAFTSLAGPLLAVGTAVAAIGAVGALVKIGSDALDAAAAFEEYEVRLGLLLQSQKEANIAIEEFENLSERTPFAVDKLTAGAATLVAVASGSREELEKLVETNANLAAVSGLPFEQSAEQLKRFSEEGIKAAEGFRKAGIDSIIESVQGIPDLTALPLAEQRRLLEETFGPDALSPFATAAEDLAFTLEGALGGIANASTEVDVALGKALAPIRFATARAIVIPFFQEMERLLEDNKDAIVDFTVEGVTGLLTGFENVLNVGADVIDFLESMGVNLSALPSDFRIVAEAFSILFDAVKNGLSTILVLLADLGLAFGQLGNLVGLATDEEVELLRTARDLFLGDLAANSQDFAAGLPARFEKIEGLLQRGKDASGEFGERMRRAATAAGLAADEVARLVAEFESQERVSGGRGGGGGGGGGGGLTPEEEELQRILAGFDGGIDVDLAAEARRRKELAEIESAVGGFGGGIDVDIAAEQRIQDERKKNAEEAAEEARKAAEELNAQVTEDLRSALGAGFALALDTSGKGFAENLADLSGTLLEESIDKALDNLAEGLAATFEELDLSKFFGSGEGGGIPGLGPALGAALGIGAQLLSRELGGTNASITGGVTDSAVTSTQALRGIVAGDVNVPIAEVAGALRDMNIETVREQRRTNTLLTQIRDQRGAAGGDTDTMTQALADAVAEEFGGSVSLG